MAEETRSSEAMQEASIRTQRPLYCLFSQGSGANAALSRLMSVDYVPEDRKVIESGAGFNERVVALLTQATVQGIPYEHIAVAHPSAFQRCQRGEGLRHLFPRETQLWAIPACLSGCWSLVLVLHVDMEGEDGVVIYVADSTPVNWNLHRSTAASVVEEALVRDSVRVYERHVLEIPQNSIVAESGVILCNALLELVSLVSYSHHDQLHVEIPACFKRGMIIKLKRGDLCQLFTLAPLSVWHATCEEDTLGSDCRRQIKCLLNNSKQEPVGENDSSTNVLPSHGKRLNSVDTEVLSSKRCRLGDEDSAISSPQFRYAQRIESIERIIVRTKELAVLQEMHETRAVCSNLLLVSTQSLLDEVKLAFDRVLQLTSEKEKPEKVRWCAEILAKALNWLPKQDELKLSDMTDRCQPIQEDVASQGAHAKRMVALNQQSHDCQDVQTCCDRTKKAVVALSLAITSRLEHVSSFRRAIKEAYSYIYATADAQQNFISLCSDLVARCQKDIEENELRAVDIKHSSTIRLRKLIEDRQLELLANGESEDSVVLQANQEVFESTSPDVIALRQERLDGETKLKHLQQKNINLKSVLTLYTAVESLSKNLQMRRDRSHESLMSTAAMTLAKIELDATTALLRYIPELRHELLIYFTRQSTQQKHAETALHDLEQELAEHDQFFCNGAPLKRKDLVQQIRELSEIATQSAQAAMQVAEDQEYLWRGKHDILSVEVQRALLVEFEILANRVDAPVKQCFVSIMNAWVQANTAENDETPMSAGQENPLSTKRESCVVM